MTLLLCVYASLIFARSVSCLPKSFYVSAIHGSDAGLGTLDLPWKTIGHSLHAIRGLSKDSDVIVYIMGGRYHESIEFSVEDSGIGSHIVRFVAYDGAMPVVSGGVVVEPSSWKETSTVGLYVAPVEKGASTRQLYVDGKRAIRARSKGGLPHDCSEVETGFHCLFGTHMSTWENPSSIEMVLKWHWRQVRCLVESIDKHLITIQQPCWKLLHSLPQHFTLLPDYFENSLELLTDPGEWYLDESSSLLYYRPLANRAIHNSTIILPTGWSQLFYGSGTDAAQIRNLAFEGLTFAYSTWKIGNAGFAENQANIPLGGSPPPAAVEFAFVDNLSFERCVFRNVGTVGLALGRGARNCRVESCEFVDTSSHGLKLGDIQPYESLSTSQASDLLVFNNSLERVVTEFLGGPAMMVGYVSHSNFSHNFVHDVPYTGISNGWGWGSVCSNFGGFNIYENNWINYTMTEMFDGGSFYTLGQQNGSWFVGNVLLHNNNCCGSLYLDDGSRYWTLHHNVVFDSVSIPEGGIVHYKGGNHLFYENYWRDGKSDIHYENTGCCPKSQPSLCGPCTLRNNTAITSLSQAPKSILDNAGLVFP